MALKLKGSTSGFVAIDAPSVAGNNTLILPENTGSAHQILANDITAGVTTFTQITVSRNGDLTVPGTISIGGTLTYEDVTSIDSVGLITARSGMVVSGVSTFLGSQKGINVVGVSTFAGNVNLSDDDILQFGDSQDLQIQYDSTPGESVISHTGPGVFKIQGNNSNNIFIRPRSGENSITAKPDAEVELFFNGVQRFETTNAGVSITGVTTSSSGFSGNLTGDVTGNADTATTLATARTIGGVSFDGSANINLPGVNSSGNQDTSGNAATATVSVNAQGLTGSPNVQVGNITVTGDLTVNGTTNSQTSTNTTVTGILTATSVNVGSTAAGIGVTLDQGGGVFSGIVTSHTVKASKALYLPLYTTTTRDAGSFTQGAVIFNTTVKKLEYYDGDNWKSIPEVSTGLVLALDS